MKNKLLFSIMTVLSLVGLIMPMPAVTAAPAPPGQTPLAASAIPQFVDPLPVLDVTGLPNGTIQTILAGTSQIEVDMKEFKANMLPHTFVPSSGTYTGTWVWGYVKPGTDLSVARDTYTGPVVVATRNVPAEFKFVNNLGSASTTNVLAYKSSTDQSIHWANPDGVERYIPNPFGGTPTWVGNPDHYSGAIPASVHLHGGEVPAAIDGGPDSWFLSDGSKVGPAYYSKGWNGVTPQNYAIYRYPNVQEAAPLWFHDHTMGATRLNVYAGLAGAYFLVDPKLKLPAGLNATGLRAGALGPNPADDTLVPLVVQDRMFDTTGQLYFPAGPLDSVSPSPNPQHQYWVPEFFGEEPNIHDTITVNGKTWPYLEVKAQRYRFLLINGSNARTYELTFQNTSATTNSATPTIWQIGTDQGYLDKPVAVDPLVIMPGERAEFIVDFHGVTPGTNLVLNNLGPDSPFGGGVPGVDFDSSDPATTGKVMQFRVVGGDAATDTSFNPATPGQTIRSNGQKIVRLVDPATGTLAKRVKPDLTRELTLTEIARELPTTVGGITYGGGPEVILLNNTELTGKKPANLNPNDMNMPPAQPGFSFDGNAYYLSELPKEGATEVWEIVNMTADAHPIHPHLVQLQLMNRQNFDVDGYMAAYSAAFPGGGLNPETALPYPPGVFMPEYGPPLSYNPSAASAGKYGGNPDVTPFLVGAAQAPNANEAGWKDTIVAPPGTVTRFVVRWAPTDRPVVPSMFLSLRYPFIPNGAIPGNPGAHYDYVWHCHIVDHEDNEMMRPDSVVANPLFPERARDYQIGRDY